MTNLNPWTEEVVERLRLEHAAGLSCSQISRVLCGAFRHFKGSRNAVIGKLHRLGLLREAASIPRRAPPAPKPPRPAKAAKPQPAPKIQNYRRGPVRAIPLDSGPAIDLPNVACNPRPWTTRGAHECAFPVAGFGADTLSCCNSTAGTYCPGHFRLMLSPNQPKTLTPGRIEWMSAA